MDSNRQKLKGLLFDLDGTVFNLNIDWQFFKDTIRNKYLGGTDLTYDAVLAKSKQPEYQELAKFIEDVECRGVDTGGFVKDAQEIVRALSKEYQIVFITRNTRRSAQKVSDLIGVKSLILGREDADMLKPDPEAIVKACRMIDASSEQCLMVGDTSHDVEAAHQAAMKCVIISNPRNSYRPHNADFYIDTMTELKELIEKEY